MKKISIATFPPISCEKQLNDIFHRLCWYTSPALERISKITIPTESDSINVGKLPSSFDSSINDHLANYEAQTEVHKLSSDETKELIESTDLIIVLDKKAYEMKINGYSLRQLCDKKKVIEFIVDTKGCDSDILNILSIAFNFKELTKLAKQRIAAIDRSKLKNKGYVLGTGPSLSSVLDIDLSDGSTIVCNSIVKNKKILKKIKPDFIVAADPIFHSGCSSYAQEFRQNVVEALHNYNSIFIVPIRDYYIYQFYFPNEYAENIIPMPFYFEGKTINFDFDNILGVTITANVLTLLLLPLAAYFFDEIGIAGCDGRPLSENSYYWGHDPSAQYTDKMSDIQKDHPGFFNVDFNEYYIKHCDVLDRWIDAIESCGKKVISITPSYIPALGYRSAEGIDRYDSSLYTEIEDAINIRRGIKQWRVINGEPSSNLSQQVVKKVEKKHATDFDLRVYPKVLILSTTAVGSLCATGDLKKKLFKGWPEDRLMQVYTSPDPKTPADNLHRFSATKSTNDRLFEHCIKFAPDIIYFRPTDTPKDFFDFAEKLINSLNTGLVTHIMDDWPQRLSDTNKYLFTEVDQSLRSILARSEQRLSICAQMSHCYNERYGYSFTPIANCIYSGEIQKKIPSKKRSSKNTFTILYSGALAEDMTAQSVREVAYAVHELSTDFDIKFQINTMDWCLDEAYSLAKRYNAVAAYPLLSSHEYMESLQSADLLLIAYNFDEASKRYTHLSFANKMPEYMASCTPILAYGPREVATIDYIAQEDFAIVVDQQSVPLIKDAILKVIETPIVADRYTQKAIEQLQSAHAAEQIIPQFQFMLIMAARQHGWSAKRAVRTAFDEGLCGAYSREDKAKLEEVHIVKELLVHNQKGTMLDVGAHYGSSSKPFLDYDWEVYAFEPDPNNRKQLKKNIGSCNKATIDPRAVSNSTGDEVSFYTSPESTGISGLSAFTDKHIEFCKVESITLTDFCLAKGINEIDFLKIDTEGFEKFILEGFPWDTISPQAILCEYEDNKTVQLGYTFHDLAQYLISKGYNVYVSEWHPIIRYGISHDWHRFIEYPCNLATPNSWGNLLALKDRPSDEVLKSTVNALIRTKKQPNQTGTPNKIEMEQQNMRSKQNLNSGLTSSYKGDYHSRECSTQKEKSSVSNASSSSDNQCNVATPAYSPLSMPHINQASMLFTQHKSFLRDLSEKIEESNPALAGLVNIIDHWILVLKKSFLGLGGGSIGCIFAFALAGWLIPTHSFVLFGISGILSIGLLILLTISYFNKVIGEIVHKQDILRDRQLSQLVNNINEILDDQHQSILKMSSNELSIHKINNLIDDYKQNTITYSNDINTLKKSIDKHSSQIEKNRKEILNDLNQQKMRIDNVTAMSKHNLKKINTISSWTQSKSAVLDQVHHNADVLKSIQEQMQSLPGINAHWFKVFSREVTKNDMEVLMSKWAAPLNSNISIRELGYIANDICLLENQSYGRFAAHIQDILARCIVARSITAKNINILEIGCLFGIHLFSLYRACASKLASIHLTALDPFEGYYDKGSKDIVTGQVVSEFTFQKNMEIANVPAENVTIVKHLSQDKAAFEAVKDTHFQMLIIDGDHSYAGIAKDIETYSKLVVKGGYIVIDDYNNKDWPQVTHYIDEKIKNNKEFMLIAEGWKTAVFMKL